MAASAVIAGTSEQTATQRCRRPWRMADPSFRSYSRRSAASRASYSLATAARTVSMSLTWSGVMIDPRGSAGRGAWARLGGSAVAACGLGSGAGAACGSGAAGGSGRVRSSRACSGRGPAAASAGCGSRTAEASSAAGLCARAAGAGGALRAGCSGTGDGACAGGSAAGAGSGRAAGISPEPWSFWSTLAVSEGAEVSGLRPWAAWAGSMDDEIVGAAGAAGSFAPLFCFLRGLRRPKKPFGRADPASSAACWAVVGLAMRSPSARSRVRGSFSLMMSYTPQPMSCARNGSPGSKRSSEAITMICISAFASRRSCLNATRSG